MSGEIADGLGWDWTATLVGIKLLMKYLVHYSDTRREGCQRLRMMNCRHVCSNDFSNDHSGRFNWFVTNWLVLISHLVIPSVIWSDRVTLSVAKKGLLDMVPCLMLGDAWRIWSPWPHVSWIPPNSQVWSSFPQQKWEWCRPPHVLFAGCGCMRQAVSWAGTNDKSVMSLVEIWMESTRNSWIWMWESRISSIESIDCEDLMIWVWC